MLARNHIPKWSEEWRLRTDFGPILDPATQRDGTPTVHLKWVPLLLLVHLL